MADLSNFKEKVQDSQNALFLMLHLVHFVLGTDKIQLDCHDILNTTDSTLMVSFCRHIFPCWKQNF